MADKKFVVTKSFHEKKGDKNLFYGHEREGRAVFVKESDFDKARWKELVDGEFVRAATADDKGE